MLRRNHANNPCFELSEMHTSKTSYERRANARNAYMLLFLNAADHKLGRSDTERKRKSFIRRLFARCIEK